MAVAVVLIAVVATRMVEHGAAAARLASEQRSHLPTTATQGGLTYLQKARKCGGITIAERFQVGWWVGGWQWAGKRASSLGGGAQAMLHMRCLISSKRNSPVPLCPPQPSQHPAHSPPKQCYVREQEKLAKKTKDSDASAIMDVTSWAEYQVGRQLAWAWVGPAVDDGPKRGCLRCEHSSEVCTALHCTALLTPRQPPPADQSAGQLPGSDPRPQGRAGGPQVLLAAAAALRCVHDQPAAPLPAHRQGAQRGGALLQDRDGERVWRVDRVGD